MRVGWWGGGEEKGDRKKGEKTSYHASICRTLLWTGVFPSLTEIFTTGSHTTVNRESNKHFQSLLKEKHWLSSSRKSHNNAPFRNTNSQHPSCFLGFFVNENISFKGGWVRAVRTLRKKKTSRLKINAPNKWQRNVAISQENHMNW